MERAADRWTGIGLSVLVHVALVAALAWGWMLFRRPPRPHATLAIEATTVDARALRSLTTPAIPKPAPPAAAAEPQGPPQPTAQELAQREAQRREQQVEQQRQEAKRQQEQQREQQLRAQQEQAAQEQRQQEEEQVRRAQEKQRAAQQAAQARAAADKAAREAAEAAKRQQQEDAQEARERQADLQRQLAAEGAATRDQAALATWVSQITARIQRAWLRPPTARAGIQCMLYVTQTPTGEVTQVSFGPCNADAAVRDSIEAAVYRASPLPPPPDPALFDRNLKINFKPD
ncbi:MAG: TonB C-terminal domain-containing protein [Proteobacteria bacterium]|nr:TonB C-terminal domain-containing protein [Pseudomonadota bacterium]